MNPITTVMRQCRLFDGIPEEKYQNVLACLRGETKLFRKDAILLQIGECQKRPGVVMDGTLRISLYSEEIWSPSSGWGGGRYLGRLWCAPWRRTVPSRSTR